MWLQDVFILDKLKAHTVGMAGDLAGAAYRKDAYYGAVNMGFFRLLAWIFVASGLALLGADGISTIEAGEPVIRTTSEVMNLFGIGISSLESDGAAAGVANFFLNAPLWAVVGILGIIMTLVFRPLD